MKILAIVDSPGAKDFLEPAWPLVEKQSEAKLITRAEAGEADSIYENFKPDLVVSGVSSLIYGPYFVNDLTKRAVGENKPVIACQDYWANHRSPLNRKMMKYWSAVLAPDQLARDYLLADGYAGKIIVTGHPGWEKFLDQPVKPKPQSQVTLLWAGSGTPGSEEIEKTSFNFLLEAIRQITPPPELIATPHPRDENPARYSQYLSPLPTDELLSRVDAVIATYSTSLIHAALMKIPAISLMLPAAKQKFQVINLDDFPLNKIGASIGVYENSPNLLTQILIKLRDDPNYRAELSAKQKTFAASLPRPAADNVAEAILNWGK